jgi:streptogramin lyase
LSPARRSGKSKRRRPLRLLVVLLALAPIIAATAVAGIITNPARIRPCVVEYSRGVTGGPLHLTLGSDGRLYASENIGGAILRFDPNTHRTAEFPVPRGFLPPQLHDVISGPDGNIWFDDTNNRLGKLDIRTGRVTLFPGVTGQPHTLVWDQGYLYIAELAAGKLARFDPKTQRIISGSYGLPPNNHMHGLVVLPDGTIWAALSNDNEIARFNPQIGRFDKFVRMPIPNSGPRDLVYVPAYHTIYVTLFAANQFASYNLLTGKVAVYPTGAKPVPLALAENTALHRFFKLTFIVADPKQDAVWASTLAAELFRLDLRTHHVTPVYCGITYPAVTAGLAFDRQGRLWVNEAFPGRIGLVEP